MTRKDKLREVAKRRKAIREEYMELKLYGTNLAGIELPEEFREERMATLAEQIRRTRYRSIPHMIEAIYSDCEAGIYGSNFAEEIAETLSGERDSFIWEENGARHRLTVNGKRSNWVVTSLPAEVHGYMALWQSPGNVRVIRAISVTAPIALEVDNDGTSAVAAPQTHCVRGPAT